jgi:hypothetical protein
MDARSTAAAPRCQTFTLQPQQPSRSDTPFRHSPASLFRYRACLAASPQQYVQAFARAASVVATDWRVSIVVERFAAQTIDAQPPLCA